MRNAQHSPAGSLGGPSSSGLLVLTLLTAALLTGGCSAPADREPLEFLNSADSGRLQLPFSEAVRVGDLLFLSGQVGNIPGTLQLVPGGIAEQTDQVLRNISAILERHGSSLDQVVKCTVFIADIAQWPAMNAVYRTWFPGPPPARSALGANGLALGALLEIECIARID